MSVQELDKIVEIINHLIEKATNTNERHSSGYPSHMDEIRDMVVFGRNIAKKMNAIVEYIDYDYILLKRNDLYIKIDWSISLHGDIEISLDVSRNANI